jgi:hemerythrin superfamily protein
MDALALLTADHNRVRGLFSRFESAHENDDTVAAAELAERIFTELDVHTTIEEELFYPGVRKLSDELREEIDEAVQEHHVAKVLIHELATLPPADPAWVAKMTVLIENVRHHAEEEESELFPSVRSATNAEWRNDVAEQLEALKQQLGAPTLADKLGLSRDELARMASQQEIPGRSSMNHDELAATVGVD